MSKQESLLVIGNVASDPRVLTDRASPMALMTVAVNRDYKDRKTNEMVKNVVFYPFTVFGDNLISYIQQNIKKGTHVLVKDFEYSPYKKGEVTVPSFKLSSVNGMVLAFAPKNKDRRPSEQQAQQMLNDISSSSDDDEDFSGLF